MPPIESCHDGFRPGRLWSLFDMINFRIGGLRTIQGELQVLLGVSIKNAELVASYPHGEKNPLVKDSPIYQENVADAKSGVEKTANMADRGLVDLKCPHIEQAINSLTWWVKQENPSWDDLGSGPINLLAETADG